MKLIIESIQDYKTKTEEYKEEFNCTAELKEDKLEIKFDDGIIEIEENKITYTRGENKIIIEPNKTNECDYETPYGMFVLDIKGISVTNNIDKISKENFTGEIAEASYEILISNVEPYTNTIKIIIEE